MKSIKDILHRWCNTLNKRYRSFNVSFIGAGQRIKIFFIGGGAVIYCYKISIQQQGRKLVTYVKNSSCYDGDGTDENVVEIPSTYRHQTNMNYITCIGNVKYLRILNNQKDEVLIDER